MFTFASIFHMWEKICVFCISKPVLLHLIWCPSIAFIYVQTTCCHYGWVKLYCVYIPHFLDSFISFRASGLFRPFGYCESCWDEHQCTVVSIVSWLMFLWVYVQEWYHWIIWQYYHFLRNIHSAFHHGANQSYT
jgi:hypothetical protein